MSAYNVIGIFIPSKQVFENWPVFFWSPAAAVSPAIVLVTKISRFTNVYIRDPEWLAVSAPSHMIFLA